VDDSGDAAYPACRPITSARREAVRRIAMSTRDPTASPAMLDEAALASLAQTPLRIRRLTPADPLHWLALGWGDFRRAPVIGLFYGLCFVLMSWALSVVFEHAPPYVLGLSGAFLLIGPFMCLGLYRVSQQLEAGGRPDFGDSVFAWQTRTAQLGIFGFVLLVLEMLWARATLVVFAVTFDGMPDFKGSLLALIDPENLSFIVAWAMLGAVFSMLIFAVSVISIPMILHRPTDAVSAGLASARLVLRQPVVMLGWGITIAALVTAAMLPWFLGLLIVGPVIGHASWHAYRAAVA
jgi:uncharacterized membrane protein